MKLFFAFFLLLPLLVMSQFTDDFSDGDFTQNPEWTGTTTHFSIDNNQLRLNSVAGQDSSYLVTASSVMDNTEWNFWVRLAFTPSDNNYARIYLASDNSNLREPLNGYFLQIGKTGTDNKRLYFYRQTGTTRTEIMAGSDNLAAATNNILRIKVTRDDAGLWQFYCAPSGDMTFLPQGDVTDNTHITTNWFGVFCKYTASNINRFYFDDFYAGPIIVDTVPPAVTGVNIIASDRLEVVFNKAVSQVSAENTMHYNVDLGIGNPLSAERSATELNKVTLVFSLHFTQALSYNLNVANIDDLSGNTLLSQDIPFAYYIPVLHDILFNELMADPNPPVGLPNHEYIELYNRTNFPINIHNWVLRHTNTERVLPNAVIPPDSFIVLVTAAAFPELQHFGKVVVVDGLSATALTNAGTSLVLYDENYNIIHAVAYSDTWYGDNNKKDGGWSLELIDPNNPCGGASNWRASSDPSGGTPGRRNAINAPNADVKRPDLVRVGIIDSVTIEVFFSERMSGAALSNVLHYTIDNGIGNPVNVEPQVPFFASAVLKLGHEIMPQTVYKITLSDEIEDCVGNSISDKNFAFFGIPEPALPNDVVINEILFNPPTGGVDYVEIYNRSNKIIDIKELRLTSKDTIMNELTSIRVISEGSYLMFPKDYLVLTTDASRVTSFFYTPHPDKFVEMSSLPQFNNASGIAVIADAANIEIDMFAYEEKMHYPLLTTVKGVSLERIHYDRPGNDRTNWHSASAGVGYGTPAYKNSQFGIIITPEDDAITIYPDIFSPDNDGHNDVLNIAYKFDEPGFVCNIMIYDARGRLVRHLVKNELLGTQGIFSWDGITEDNLKATIGIYVIYIEVFNTTGTVKKYKKTAVLGGKLNQ